MLKIHLDDTIKIFKKYFFILVGLVLVSLLCCSGFVYYKYVYKIDRREGEVEITRVSINNQVMAEVIDNLGIRMDNLEKVQKNDYSSPFKD